jgi:hypothetical protein
MEVDFLERLRSVEGFSSVELLLGQMREDIAHTRSIATRWLEESPHEQMPAFPDPRHDGTDE